MPLRPGWDRLALEQLAKGNTMMTGTTEQGALETAECGTGTPIVMIHGMLSDQRWWMPQNSTFSQSYRSIALSLPGAWPTQETGGTTGEVAGDAAQVAAFVRGLGLGPVYILGHSRGAAVALRVSLNNPDLVRSLVLVDPPEMQAISTDDPHREHLTQAAELIDSGQIEKGLQAFSTHVHGTGMWDRFSRRQKQGLRDNAQMLPAYVRDRSAQVSLAEINSIACPVLLVTGEYSPEVYRRSARWLLEALSDGKHTVLTGASHALTMQKPLEFNQLVLNFLKRSDGSRMRRSLQNDRNT